MWISIALWHEFVKRRASSSITAELILPCTAVMREGLIQHSCIVYVVLAHRASVSLSKLW